MSTLTRLAVHAAPRSGSSWLGAILDSSPEVAYRFQPLFSYGHKGRLTGKSSKEEIDAFFNEILESTDAFVNQIESKKEKLLPEFHKNNPTHIVYKEVRYHHILANLLEKDRQLKLIGLIRNPLAVIHSWLNAPKEFRADLGWHPSEEWRYASKKNQDKEEEFNGYEKWKECVQIFESLFVKYPERVYIVNYKDLIMNTPKAVSSIFAFAGLTMGEQTISYISKERNDLMHDHPYSVFKKKTQDDGWIAGLNIEIRDTIINDIQGTKFEKYL